MNLYFRIGYRNLLKRKLRTFLTLISVILGVAVILAVRASSFSTSNSYAMLMDAVSGKVNFTVSKNTPSGFSAKKINSIKKIPGIKLAVESLSKYTVLLKEDKRIVFQVMGINPAIDKKIRKYILKKGSFLTEKSHNKIVLVNDFAQDNNLKIDKNISVLTKNGRYNLKVAGTVKKTGAGLLEDGAIGFVNIDDAKNLFGTGKNIGQIDVEAKKGTNLSVLKRAIEKKLGSAFSVDRPASRNKDAENLLRSFNMALEFFGLIAIFVGGFLIFNTFSMNLAERAPEIGTLRCLGASRRQIKVIVLLEALAIGIVGSAVGLLLGLFLANFVYKSMIYLTGTFLGNVVIDKQTIVISFLTGIAISLLSAYLPAHKASLTEPISVLKVHKAQKAKWLELKGWLVGLLLIVLGTFLVFNPFIKGETGNLITKIGAFTLLTGVILMIPLLITPLGGAISFLLRPFFSSLAIIGGRNIPRAKVRNTLTIAALLVGLVMVIGIEGMSISYQQALDNWIKSAIGAQILIRPKISQGLEIGKVVPVDLSVMKEIKKVSSVKIVTPIRFLKVKVSKSKGKVLFAALDPRKARRILNFNFIDGKKDNAFNLMYKGKGILISTIIKDKLGYKIGQSIPLKTAKGIKSFKIVGVISDFISEEGTIISPWIYLKKYFEINNADGFDVAVKKGYSIRKTKKRLTKKLWQKYGLWVMTNQEFRKEISKILKRTFLMMDAIVFIALIIAVFGMVNTLTMNVAERIREIGILRAVGTSRNQVALIILIEAIIIGTIGSFIGVACGLFTAKIMINAVEKLTLFPIPLVFPKYALLITVPGGLLLSVIAGIFPARKAAKTNLVKALHYE